MRAPLVLFIATGMLLVAPAAQAQKPANWTNEQLMAPADLSNALRTAKDTPLIICVGPGATIPNSIDVGMVNHTAGLDKLKAQLNGMDSEKKIVIYCGCCPFEHCPNVRPAIDVLKELKFTNYYLLNLPKNLKTDWIDKGYPVSKS